jgi:hypothetical protein
MHKTPHLSTACTHGSTWLTPASGISLDAIFCPNLPSFFRYRTLIRSNLRQHTHTSCSFHPRTSELSFNPLREATCGISRPAHVLYVFSLSTANVLRLHRSPGLVGDLYLDDTTTSLILFLNNPSCSLDIRFYSYRPSFGMYCRFSLPH